MEPHDPPPPYSETDTFSAPPGQSPVIGTGSDDASLAASSVIFTPPDTPRESHRSFNEGSYDPHHRHSSAPSNASAQAYFEFRSAGGRWHGSSPNLGITSVPIVLAERTTPAELPFPPALLRGPGNDFDITEQDWQTFINYLLPDHASQANSHIIDRKLRDEAAANGAGRTSSDLAEAQLGQIRPESGGHDVAERNRVAQDTVQEWNAAFFGPRGVTIQLNYHDRPGHSPNPAAGMPGAWLADNPPQQYRGPSPHHQAGGSPQGGMRTHPGMAQPLPGPQPYLTTGPNAASQAQEASTSSYSGWNPFSQNGALRFGPVVIDGDRVAVGNSFVADSNGVKWKGKSVEKALGNLVPPFPGASSSSSQQGGSQRQMGAPWRPNPTFQGDGFGLEHGHEQGFHGRRGSGGRGGRGRGRGWGWGGGYCHPHQHGPSTSAAAIGQEQGVSQARGSQEELNPDIPVPEPNLNHPGSEHDASSDSEESSVSSSSSESSIGSLPDYDDLRDSQLPVVKQNISVWLAHPEQPVTREMLQKAKADIKSAKRKPVGTPPSSIPSVSENREQEEKLPPPPTYDETQAAQTAALREEVKVLMTAWQGLKRAQRQQRKADRKVRRAQRKAVRKERRAKKKADRKAKRAIKAANKTQRKQERNADRQASQQDERAKRQAERDEQQLARQREQSDVRDQREQQRRENERRREEQQQQRDLQQEQRQREREHQQQQRERMGPWQQPGGVPWSPFNHNQHSQQPFGAPNFPFGPGGSPLGGQQPGAVPFLGRGGNAWQGRGGPWGHAHHQPHPHPHHVSHSFSGNPGNIGSQHIPGAWPQPPHQQWRDSNPSNLSSSDDSHHNGFSGIAMNDNDHDNNHDSRGAMNASNPVFPSAPSQNSKYEEIDRLEAQIADKIAHLSLLGEHIAKEQIEAAKRGEGDVKSKPKTSEQIEAEALERDMEFLMQDVERLKVEADEEAARRVSREG